MEFEVKCLVQNSIDVLEKSDLNKQVELYNFVKSELARHDRLVKSGFGGLAVNKVRGGKIFVRLYKEKLDLL